VSRRYIGTKRQNQFAGSLKSQECTSRDYGHDGTVCVCNLTHCDTIPRPERVERPQLIVYSSNRAGLRFHRTIQNFTSDVTPQIYINPRKEYQTVLGWGGAFTDSTGININSLDQELQGKLLRSYFGPDGIEYSLCRVPMGGTDFSTRAYSYDDGEEDKELNNFRLAREDYLYKVVPWKLWCLLRVAFLADPVHQGGVQSV
jgi:glucosylceramidase